MWPGDGAAPINLPPATARRRLVQGKFLEEVMELPPEVNGEPFTRISYFNYNAVNQQYECFSIDTRGPQMMNERSYESSAQGKTNGEGTVILYGGSFVAPQWGAAKNVAFRYRLTVGAVQDNRQIVGLYFTPLSGEPVTEFMAFEYVYTKRH